MKNIDTNTASNPYFEKARYAKRTVNILMSRLDKKMDIKDIFNYVKDNLTAAERIVISCGVFVGGSDDERPKFNMPRTSKVVNKMTDKNIAKFEKGFTKISYKTDFPREDPNVHRVIVDNYLWIPDDFEEEAEEIEETNDNSEK